MSSSPERSEPLHPSYGSLDQLLAGIGRDIRDGWYIRMGQINALNWFSDEYGALEEIPLSDHLDEGV